MNPRTDQMLPDAATAILCLPNYITVLQSAGEKGGAQIQHGILLFLVTA